MEVKDTKLKVIQNDKEVEKICATVKDGYAVAEIELRPKTDSAKYKDWDKKLDPDTGDEKSSELYLKVVVEGIDSPATNKAFLKEGKEKFELGAAISIYEIYYNYKIYREEIEGATKGKYYYYDSTNTKHFIGSYIFKKIKNKYSGYGGKNINLVNLNQVKRYEKGNIKFDFNLESSSRPYVNELTLASLLGAMLNCGYEDFTCNGFSKEDGSPGVSTSHKNGYNGDFRYLRTDKSGNKVYLNKEDETGDPCGWKGMDETRQNKFNDELYGFGWKSMLSWKYGKTGSEKLLHHSSHYDDHHHHLHTQGYNPNIKDK